MNITWEELNSVNISELDEDHQEIAALINRLSRTTSKDGAGRIIRKLEIYAIEHFKAEESYFKKYQYPAAEPHVRQHQAFLRRIRQFRRQYDAGVLENARLLEFLNTWWLAHINNSDQKYTDFLNQQGVF